MNCSFRGRDLEHAAVEGRGTLVAWPRGLHALRLDAIAHEHLEP